MVETFTVLPSFWSQIINPSDPISIKFPQECYLILKNVCIGELPENFSNNPIRLMAHVISANFNEEKINDISTKNLIGTLIPGEKEHFNLNVLFSPTNEVSLQVIGNYPLHITGILIPIIEDEEEEFIYEIEDD